MEISWNEIKNILDSRKLSAQYVIIGNNYWIKAIDGPFEVDCLIPTDPNHEDTIDFENNYKLNGNKTPNSQVTTQFEINNKIMRLFSASASVIEDGTAQILIKIPGTLGVDIRYINSGEAFFDVADPGDKVTEVRFVDHDNILGYGADTIVGSYTDDDAPLENQGWYIPPKRGTIKAETIGYYGTAPAGLYARITAKKGGGITTGTFFVNMEWAAKNNE